MLYFKKAKSGAKEGFLAGIVMLITGVILDAAITVPLFVKSYSTFFSSPLIASYLGGVAIMTIVGALKKK